MAKNKGLWLIAIYFFLAIYLLPMFPPDGSADELTRWATAASLVEKSSFEISWTEDLIGKNSVSVSVGDRVYAAQSPGTAVLAAPFYALTRLFTGEPDASNLRTSWFVMRFFLSTLPLLLLAWWLYGYDADEMSLAALLFATPLFIYSLVFFAHVLVAVTIYLAFRLLYDTERLFRRNCLAAGLISGLAFVCEPAVLIPILIFAAGLFFVRRADYNRRQFVFVYALGVLPFIAALLLYNNAIFGSPFAFPYLGTAESADASGVGLSPLSNFYTLLFSPARGLFFYSPVLFLSILAFFSSRERHTLRHRVKVAAILVSFIALCFFPAGGTAFGAQRLIFIMPLMLDSFFDGEIYEFSNFWQGLLFAVSFLFCTVPALTFPFAPPEFSYPHNEFWRQLLFDSNLFAPTLANVFGFPANVWTLTPAVVLLLAAIYTVWRYSRHPLRFFAGALAAFSIVVGYLFMPLQDSAEKAERRRTVAARYFGQTVSE